MNLDYIFSGIKRTGLLEYIDEILTSFEKMDPSKSGTKSSAAPENMFKVDKHCDKLSIDKAKVFHKLLIKTL